MMTYYDVSVHVRVSVTLRNLSNRKVSHATDTDTDTDMITVFVHNGRLLDFVSQTKGIHLSALAFIMSVMSVFLTNMTDRDPRFYTHRFACKWLAIFYLYQARYQ